MHKDLLPHTFIGKLEHVVEECAEVIHAAQKLKRFGVHGRLPGMSNNIKLANELRDLKHAIQEFEKVFPVVPGDPGGIAKPSSDPHL